MGTESLTVLGFSEATLTMVLDACESVGWFPRVLVVNNLNVYPSCEFANPGFELRFASEPEKDGPFCLGVYKSATKIAVHRTFFGRECISIVHASASVSKTASVGKGCLVNSLSSVAAHAIIGDFVSINRNVSVGHHSEIGDFSTINPGVDIAGFVRVGEGSTLGIGCCVVDGVSIGSNSVVGAGSVVTRDIPDGVVAYGSPCKVIRQKTEEDS